MLKAKTPVILVHGILNSSAIFKKMAHVLEDAGCRVYAPNLHPNTGRTGLEMLAEELKQFIANNIDADENFHLVGFSMGGLVCRYYLQRLNGMQRVLQFISLSTPHFGTWLAYIWSNKGCRQMRPGSNFLKDLNSDIQSLRSIYTTSIWTPFDLTVFPPHSSILPFGNQYKIPVFLHPLVPRNKRVIEKVDLLIMENNK